MKMLKKATKKRIHPLLEMGNLANGKLAGAFKRNHEQQRRLVHDQIRQAIKASKKIDGNLSKKIAEFRFKYAKKINNALLSDPRFPSRFFIQHLGDLPGDPLGEWRGNPKDNPIWKELIIIAKFLEESFTLKTPYDPDKMNRPVITSYPNPIIIGDYNYYTIVGYNFRTNPGGLYITLSDSGMRIDPVIIWWTNEAICFKIPSSVGGVPFQSQADMTVENVDGLRKSAHVVVEPFLIIYNTDYITYSDSGFKNPILHPGYNYEKIVTLTSPTLPEEYELFEANVMPALGLELQTSNNTYFPDLPYIDTEHPGTFDLLEGPYESGGCLQIRVKVNDDWYWDYEITARFFISVPQGYSVPPGWRTA